MHLGKLGIKKPTLFYGWIVAVACFFVLVVSGGQFYSLGIFFKPLEDEFEWSRTLISSANTTYLVAFALSTYICGRLSDKYGLRFLVIGGGVLMGIGYSLCSQVQSIWQLYICFALAGLGCGPTLSPPAAVVQRWFMKRRGLVLGMALAGVGLGNLIFPPIINYLISSLGWRRTFIIEGLLSGIVLIFSALVIVDYPEKKGLKPYGAEELALYPAEGRDNSKVWTTQIWSTAKAIKTRTFWLLSLLWMLSILPTYMVSFHIVRYAIDIGIREAVAAGALGLMGGISTVGKIGMGGVSDKIGWKTSVAICCFGAGAAIVWLIGIRNLWMLYLFVVIYGFFFGGRLPQVMGLIGFLFGTASLPELIALIQAIAILGGCSGPLIAGYVFDRTGSYTIAFSIAAACSITAGILALIIKPPRKVSAN